MKRIRIVFFLIILFIGAAIAQAEIYKQLRIYNPEERTVRKILNLGMEPIFSRPGAYVDFAVSEQMMPAFQHLRIPYSTIHEDLSAFYESRNAGTTMGGFRTFNEMVAVMDSFAFAYPNFCASKFSIATTGQGRPIWVMKVSDNPGANELEPEAFISGLIHAREPISGEICLEFMRFLFTNYGIDPIATDLINNYQLYFCPIMNPDGYEYNRQTNPAGGGMWRKNRHLNGDGSIGVDLNRNFSYFWGYDDNGSSPYPSAETYRGATPASEPEITGVQNFVNEHDFAIVLNYHAYGNLFLFPWGYYNVECDDYSLYDTLGAVAESIGYSVGSPWELLYNVNGDIVDWSYGEDRLHKKCISQVIEVGNDYDGFWPQLNRIGPLIGENISILKDLLPRAFYIYKRRLPQMLTITSPDSVAAGSRFFLHWQSPSMDTFNQAISYRVTTQTGYARHTQNFEDTQGYFLDNFTRTNISRHSGSYSVYSGQGNNMRNYVTFAERLKIQRNENLTFWALYNIENGYDYAYVQVSTNGGQTWWEINGNLSTDSNPHRHNKGFGITGSSNGNWVQGIYPLGTYSGQELKVRFAYWTDASVNPEGIYIDDVFPYDEFDSTIILSENANSESLLVGPFGTGPRWFNVEARDDQGQLGPTSDHFQIEVTGSVYSLIGRIRLSNPSTIPDDAIVCISSLGLSDTTAEDGIYNISLIPPGTYDITASLYGYYPDTAFSYVISENSMFDWFLEQALPSAPTIISPQNNSVFDTEYVAFDWNDAQLATGYILEIAEDIGFNNIAVYDSNLTFSDYENSTPFLNGQYYWRVTAFNEAGYSNRSEINSFTINIFLSPPDLLFPNQAFVSDSSYLTFSWASVFRADRYAIEISRDSLFTNVGRYDSNLTATIYTNIIPFQNRTYYWRVTAFWQGFSSPRSQERIFTVNTPVAPAILQTPPRDLLTDQPIVNFDWNDVQGATGYIIEIAVDSLFLQHVVADSSILISAFTDTLSDGRYFWRVVAYNGSIYSDNSETRSFTVRTYLASPELLFPVNGYISNSNLINFAWTNAVGARYYVFETASDSIFTNPGLIDSTHIDTTYGMAGPFANGHYYWRVTASDSLVYSERSATGSFTIDNSPDLPCPILLLPGDGFISHRAFVNFDWTDSSSGLTYLFELSGNHEFSQMVISESTLTESNYINSLPLASNDYFWRVKTTDGVQWSAYSEIRGFEVGSLYLPGDANNSNIVNGLDVVFLINYFKGWGPAPSPFLAGDANGSCSVNGLDVVYLVRYFKGGPAPFGGDCDDRIDIRR
ncbi:MAG TPA: hypothetical protein DEO84_06420 [candidate division Zixibacteria bacterium]|nr:hypothetical protein [candidate division Zixibacteria bacterium]